MKFLLMQLIFLQKWVELDREWKATEKAKESQRNFFILQGLCPTYGFVEPDNIEYDDILLKYLNELKRKVVVSTQEKDHTEELICEKGTVLLRRGKELLYNIFRGNKVTVYGTLMEDKDRKDYIGDQHTLDWPQ